jgi:hypothetical protein
MPSGNAVIRVVEWTVAGIPQPPDSGPYLRSATPSAGAWARLERREAGHREPSSSNGQRRRADSVESRCIGTGRDLPVVT